ncbi:hypothetical protein [Rhodococcus sp. ACS1]|uniref:hypothetical protein n=1 Tax=Rhodococcus sp. ACS1 TaxID=2028570 RepID=UPI0027B94D4F|nr:hypothetical protein [Rhodococcus sp. ACS1]
MWLGTNAVNRTEYHLRPPQPRQPACRCPRPGRTDPRIAAAIRTGLACGEATDRIEERIRCAEAAGLPLTLW